MQLVNTLTRQLETVKPLDGQEIRLYSCGPTVYDRIHIGNLSSFIMADTLARTLRSAGFRVRHVMNFTDVDDKTIRRSQERNPSLPPKQALQKLTDEYIDLFLNDSRAIGNDVEQIEFIRATDAIADMQTLILELLDNGVAYRADDGIYFSIDRYRARGRHYGQLTELNIANTAAARINNDEYDKDSVHDFALWKKQKPAEPVWQFSVNNENFDGRPGWHIECSAMSRKLLGQPFDIHTGGVDLLFPHHENEIAQSTAASDDARYAQMFVHNEHLLIDGKKMSKSLNNFYTLADVISKGFDPLAFRLLVLQGHYAHQLNFTWESLGAAQNRLHDLRGWADLRHQPTTDTMYAELDELFGRTYALVEQRMQQNLDSPGALAALSTLVSYMSTHPVPGVDGKHTVGVLAKLDALLGLQLDKRPDVTAKQKELLQARSQARANKDWEGSDKLRAQLQSQGIGVRDTDNGQIWFRL